METHHPVLNSYLLTWFFLCRLRVTINVHSKISVFSKKFHVNPLLVYRFKTQQGNLKKYLKILIYMHQA